MDAVIHCPNPSSRTEIHIPSATCCTDHLQLSAESFSRTCPRKPPHWGSQGHPHPMTGHCKGIKTQSSSANSGQLCKASPASEIPKGLCDKCHSNLRLFLGPSHIDSTLSRILLPSLLQKAWYSPVHALSVCFLKSLLYTWIFERQWIYKLNQMHSSLLICFYYSIWLIILSFGLEGVFILENSFHRGQGNIVEPGKEYTTVTLSNTTTLTMLNTMSFWVNHQFCISWNAGPSVEEGKETANAPQLFILTLCLNFLSPLTVNHRGVLPSHPSLHIFRDQILTGGVNSYDCFGSNRTRRENKLIMFEKLKK